MCGGVLLSFRERRAVNKQKSEGLVSVALDIGTTTLNVRFRLTAVLRSRRLHVAIGPTAGFRITDLAAESGRSCLICHTGEVPPNNR